MIRKKQSSSSLTPEDSGDYDGFQPCGILTELFLSPFGPLDEPTDVVLALSSRVGSPQTFEEFSVSTAAVCLWYRAKPHAERSSRADSDHRYRRWKSRYPSGSECRHYSTTGKPSRHLYTHRMDFVAQDLTLDRRFLESVHTA